MPLGIQSMLKTGAHFTGFLKEQIIFKDVYEQLAV